MSVDAKTVARVATLARIKVEEKDLPSLAQELNGILAWIEQLNEVDTSNVTPFFEGQGGHYLSRQDEITDGDRAGDILSNAPEAAHGFFAVPKVVE